MSKKKVAKKATKKKLFGPDLYKRDEHGLLENVDYVFNEDGSVNWRAMIKPEFLYPNRDWFNYRNKPVPDSSEGLADNQLLIMLGGIKELARLRGFENVSFEIDNVSESYVVASCEILWSPNYESGKERVGYQDVANATLDNTDSFASKFLETIACNRAFVRCVRNFLNIHIVGADEIDKSKGANNSISVESVEAAATTPIGLLQKTLLSKKGVSSFEDFIEMLKVFWKNETYKNEDVAKWKSWKDIPSKEIRKLIGLLHK
tara:strand:- start:33545 stop:34327 length:783 start_codon:yes stop_codon:yes gene_type:complete